MSEMFRNFYGWEGQPQKDPKWQQAERTSRTIAGAIGEVTPPNWGFALLMFDFSGPGFTWISNANREDMIRALKELIGNFEKGTHGAFMHPDPKDKPARLAAMIVDLKPEDRVALFGHWCQQCGLTLVPGTPCPHKEGA
jgi:hypothetical protein